MTRDPRREATEDALRMTERVEKLLLRSGNCAQTAFAVLQERFDLEGGQVLRALTPLPGIALRGETCGAVIGALMALGLVHGRDDLDDWRGYLRSLPAARRFCARFEEVNGSTSCSAILHRKLGRAFDLSDKAEALAYVAVGGPQVCGEVVGRAVELACEAIEHSREPVSEPPSSAP